MMKIEFKSTIICSGRSFNGYTLVEAFDNYFYLGGRKYRVIKPLDKNSSLVKEELNGKTSFFLTALKIVSYFTLVIPLIMFLGKCMMRSKYEFFLDKKEVVGENQGRVETQKVSNSMKEKKKLRVFFSLHEFGRYEIEFFHQLKKHCDFMSEGDFFDCLKNPADKDEFIKLFRDKFILLFSHNGLMKLELGKIADYFNQIQVTDECKESLKLRTKQKICEDVQGLLKILDCESSDKYLKALGDIVKDQRRIDEMIDRNKLDRIPNSLKSNFYPTSLVMQRLTRFPITLENISSQLQTFGLHTEARLIGDVKEKVKKIVDQENLKMNICLAEYYLDEHQRFSEMLETQSYWNWLVGGLQAEINNLNKKINFDLFETKRVLDNDPIAYDNPESDEAIFQHLKGELLKITIEKDKKRITELETVKELSEAEKRELQFLKERIEKSQNWINELTKNNQCSD